VNFKKRFKNITFDLPTLNIWNGKGRRKVEGRSNSQINILENLTPVGKCAEKLAPVLFSNFDVF
jgi:hypothetical protein